MQGDASLTRVDVLTADDIHRAVRAIKYPVPPYRVRYDALPVHPGDMAHLVSHGGGTIGCPWCMSAWRSRVLP